jgi:hypothetical protein
VSYNGQTIDVVRRKPTGFVLKLDGEIIEEAGNGGVIGSYEVTDRIRRSLCVQYPNRKIELLGCFTLRQKATSRRAT